jgi:DNA gyrase subunit A
MRLTDARGALVGAVIVGAGDEVMAIRSSGQVTRSRVDDVPVRNRLTMGVKYVDVAAGDEVLAIARNAEADLP